LAPRAVSLPHQGKGRTSEDLEGGKPPLAPDQDLESKWIFKSASSFFQFDKLLFSGVRKVYQFSSCPSRAPQLKRRASWGRDALFFVNWTKQKCTTGKQGPDSGWFYQGGASAATIPLLPDLSCTTFPNGQSVSG